MTKEEFMGLGIPEEQAAQAAEASAAELEAVRVECAVRLAVSDAWDIDLVVGLLDMSRLRTDGNGGVDGLEEQLEALRRDKPFLFRQEEKRSPGFSVGAAPAQTAGAAGRRPLAMKDAIAAKISAQRA